MGRMLHRQNEHWAFLHMIFSACHQKSFCLFSITTRHSFLPHCCRIIPHNTIQRGLILTTVSHSLSPFSRHILVPERHHSSTKSSVSHSQPARTMHLHHILLVITNLKHHPGLVPASWFCSLTILPTSNIGGSFAHFISLSLEPTAIFERAFSRSSCNNLHSGLGCYPGQMVS